MSRTAWVTLLILIGAVAFAAILRSSQAEAPVANESVRAHVSTMQLVARSLPGEVRADGFLRAFADVTVSAERAGRIASLPVDEGVWVKKGVVVAQLDMTDVDANLLRARAVARDLALQPHALAADRARADEALRLAEHEVALRRPTAPVEGTVDLHHVDAGEYVMPGTPLVDIVDARVVILDVDVDAELVGRLAQGDAVKVIAPALGADAHSGRITRLAGRADPRTRRFRVEVSLAARDTGLRPGMHAVALLQAPAGAPALYVPKAATRTVRGQTGVYVIRDGRAHWVTVTVTEVYHRPDLWRLAPGAPEEGAMVVVAGFSGLRDGMAVEVAK